jgi:Zn-dependent M28 family amino/carboxypeptidase
MCASRFAEYGFEAELHNYGTGVNVIGVRAGDSDPGHQVLVGAHYDSVADCAGADDNASGTAGTLEAARVLSMTSYPRTLVVVCWDEEATGLMGSTAHAKRAAESGDEIDAVFNLEMVGYADETENTQKLPTVFPTFVTVQNDANKRRGNFIMGVGDPGAKGPLWALQAYSERAALPFMPVQLTKVDLVNPFLVTVQRSDHGRTGGRAFRR